jgi:hypothetical protein
VKITLDSERATVKLRGRVEDGPVMPQGPGLPWSVVVTEIEILLSHTDTWRLHSGTLIAQVLDSQGRIDPDDEYRYSGHFDSTDCPDWVERLVAKIVPFGMAPVALPQEFYII